LLSSNCHNKDDNLADIEMQILNHMEPPCDCQTQKEKKIFLKMCHRFAIMLHLLFLSTFVDLLEEILRFKFCTFWGPFLSICYLRKMICQIEQYKILQF